MMKFQSELSVAYMTQSNYLISTYLIRHFTVCINQPIQNKLSFDQPSDTIETTS